MKKSIFALIFIIVYKTYIFAGTWEIEKHESGAYSSYVYKQFQPLTGNLLKNQETICLIEIGENNLGEMSTKRGFKFFAGEIKDQLFLYALARDEREIYVTFRNNDIEKSYSGSIYKSPDGNDIIIDFFDDDEEHLDFIKTIKKIQCDKWDIFIKGDDWNLKTQMNKIPIAKDKNYPYFILKDGKYFAGIRVWEKAEITSVVIPEGVTEISFQAFHNCPKIESITIPSTINIEPSIFNLPSFATCSNLRTVILSDSLEVICPNLLFGCNKIETIKIPKSVKSIGHLAFAYCTSLKSINIPEGTTTISRSAFNGCVSLESLDTASNFWHIKDVFLMGGDAIVSVLNTNLEKYILPKNIQRDDFNQVVVSCSNIKELVISSPTKIRDIDFSEEIYSSYLKNLKKITVPSSVKLLHFPTSVQIIKK